MKYKLTIINEKSTYIYIYIYTNKLNGIKIEKLLKNKKYHSDISKRGYHSLHFTNIVSYLTDLVKKFNMTLIEVGMKNEVIYSYPKQLSTDADVDLYFRLSIQRLKIENIVSNDYYSFGTDFISSITQYNGLNTGYTIQEKHEITISDYQCCSNNEDMTITVDLSEGNTKEYKQDSGQMGISSIPIFFIKFNKTRNNFTLGCVFLLGNIYSIIDNKQYLNYIYNEDNEKYEYSYSESLVNQELKLTSKKLLEIIKKKYDFVITRKTIKHNYYTDPTSIELFDYTPFSGISADLNIPFTFRANEVFIPKYKSYLENGNYLISIFFKEPCDIFSKNIVTKKVVDSINENTKGNDLYDITNTPISKDNYKETITYKNLQNLQPLDVIPLYLLDKNKLNTENYIVDQKEAIIEKTISYKEGEKLYQMLQLMHQKQN